MSVALPVDAIRSAVAASDWDAAHALLTEHEAQLRASLTDGAGADERSRAALAELLAAQRALIDELRAARDEAGRALERSSHERRGLDAYAKASG